MRRYFVGVDLGQSQDFTAIAAMERAEVQGEWDPAMYTWRKDVVLRLRYLERIPLGTPYPEVVERVVQVTQSPALRGQCRLMVDGTGVGRPVVDLLRQARPGCAILPVLVTGGERETVTDGYYHVPKRDLITGLQLRMQRGELRIAAGMAFGAELLREMTGMQVRVTRAGNETFGAWREGSHDDLVFAVALACWGVGKAFPHRGNGWSQGAAPSDLGKMVRGI